MADYDLIVAGLGAHGAAAVYHAANAGLSVLGLDRFAPPHEMGSSHGQTRITRLAIGEGEHLTPIVRRSHALWRRLEAESGERLLVETGGLFISSDRRRSQVHVADFFATTLAAAKVHGIAHEVLDAPAMRARFPQFAVRDDERGYYEPQAGYLHPEACIRAQLALAARGGAQLRCGEPVLRWQGEGAGVRVWTPTASYTASRLVLSAGAWMPQLVGARIAPLLVVLRQVLHWYAIEGDGEGFRAPAMPVFIWELQTGNQAIYGFPSLDGRAVKIATEQLGAQTTPEAIERQVGAEEGATLWHEAVGAHIPGLAPRPIESAVCMYTVTPDSGFVIDAHPDCERVLIASPCSGHGFKHSAALGEGMAHWARDGALPRGYSPFALSRFAP